MSHGTKAKKWQEQQRQKLEKVYALFRDMYKQKFAMTAKQNPDKCYYLAVENDAGEFSIFGIILDGKDVDVYIEPVHKAGVYLKLSDENAAALKNLIKDNDVGDN